MYQTEVSGAIGVRGRMSWLLAYLRARSFGPLLFVSALAFALITGQHYAVDERWLGFLRWNMILAWVPYGAALALDLALRWGLTRWAALPLAAVWLLFLPNAPYILTDMMHIWGANLDALWYTVGMIAACGLAGVFLAVVSIEIVAGLVRERYGAGLSWALVLSAVLLAGFGVVLGRFGRLNSWDVLRHPRGFLLNTYLAVSVPELALRTYGTTLIFAAIMLACYLMFACRRAAQ